MEKVFLSFLLVIFTKGILAQDAHLVDELAHHSHHDSTKNCLGKDLNKGRFEFHKRSFFMSTVNKSSLTDYSTLATGAGLGYYSPSWKNFHLGFSGFFVFQVFENNINLPDPSTNSVNRYEVLLYDMNDLENSKDLDRLEELNLSYEKDSLKLIFGRQKFNSPLLNEQDNRMRPNIFNGFSFKYLTKKIEWHAAWFYALTIRGTVDWYSFENSYGVYPFGRSPFGIASQYKGNIKTAGIGVIGAKYKHKHLQSQLWNYYNENVFNLSFGQIAYLDSFGSLKTLLGAQGLLQTAVNKGGNNDINKAYILPNEHTQAIGFRLQAELQKHTISLNSLHIAQSGRFLFPREWGREIFYASLPRERFEGNGGVRAYSLKYSYLHKKEGFSTEWGIGKVALATIDNTRLNKYGLPSYYHFTALLDYPFSKYLTGLDVKFLLVHKLAQNPEEVPDIYRINRVDLWHFNVVIDYRF